MPKPVHPNKSKSSFRSSAIGRLPRRAREEKIIVHTLARFPVSFILLEVTALGLHEDKRDHMIAAASSKNFAQLHFKEERTYEKTAFDRDASRSYGRAHACCPGG
jgi:hypothetical protein